MIELYHENDIVATYEPIGWGGAMLIRQTQYNRGAVHKQDVYAMGTVSWQLCQNLKLVKIVRDYWLDARGNLWRDTDCDNFHCSRFHGYRVDGVREPIWVAERSSWPDDGPRRMLNIEHVCREMEKQWQPTQPPRFEVTG